MASNIDPTVPSGPVAYTADVRRNFATAKSEITALQVATANPVTSVSGRVGAIILSHIDITDWNAATASLGLWKAGTVNAIGSSLVLNAQGTLNAAASSAQHYLGNYNALTNTPSIGALGTGSGGGVNGNTWVVNVAGTVAADGVGAVNVSDQIVNSGSLWVRQPWSTGYGSMAIQNANNVNISGGSIVGLAMLNTGNVVLTGGTITNISTLGAANVTLAGGTIANMAAIGAGPDDVWAPSPSGAYAYDWHDQFGMIAGFLSLLGVFNFTSIVARGVNLASIVGTGVNARANINDIGIATDGTGGLIFVDEFGYISIQLFADGSVLMPGGVRFSAAGIALPGGVSFPPSGPSFPGGLLFQASPMLNRALSVTDAFGFEVAGITNDGTGVGIWSGSSSGVSTGFSAVEIDALDGQSAAQSLALRDQTDTRVMRPTKGYNLIIGYGQSLSMGVGGQPPLNYLTASYDSLMLGTNSIGLNQGTNNYTPAGNSLLNPLINVGAEHPHLDATNFWRQLQLQSRALDLDPTRVFVEGDVGNGGQSIEQLSKGADPEQYNRITMFVQAVHDAVALRGGTLSVAAIMWLQGETNYLNTGYDYTEAGYRAKLLQLISDINADSTVGIVGQTIPAAFFITQTDSWWDTGGADITSIGMAQLNASLQNPSIYLCGPYYHAPDVSGHLSSDGYALIGAQAGKVMHKVIDQGARWLPLYPTSVVARGNQILVQFHVPAPPLVFDLPYVQTTPTDFPGKGFRVYDTTGDRAITSVAIVGKASVLITVPGKIDLTLSPTLQYAGRKTYLGVGCLRDSDPTLSKSISSLTGQPFQLANWCVAFTLPIVGSS